MLWNHIKLAFLLFLYMLNKNYNGHYITLVNIYTNIHQYGENEKDEKENTSRLSLSLSESLLLKATLAAAP